MAVKPAIRKIDPNLPKSRHFGKFEVSDLPGRAKLPKAPFELSRWRGGCCILWRGETSFCGMI
jgi:hypothetical protein